MQAPGDGLPPAISSPYRTSRAQSPQSHDTTQAKPQRRRVKEKVWAVGALMPSLWQTLWQEVGVALKYIYCFNPMGGAQDYLLRRKALEIKSLFKV